MVYSIDHETEFRVISKYESENTCKNRLNTTYVTYNREQTKGGSWKLSAMCVKPIPFNIEAV